MSISNLFLENKYDIYCNILRINKLLKNDIKYGQWNPMISNTSGYTSVSILFARFFQMGDIVLASFTFDSVATGVESTLFLQSTIPIPRTKSGNFSTSGELTGFGCTNEKTSPNPTFSSCSVTAETNSQHISVMSKRLTSTLNRNNTITFSYHI